ncbi:Putative auto-transporter adhesin, head GIN domain [Catalinimonas alkaloidigena]|uniref:Putative auto-transporter adhesin, head GIN domain n=1 Tax=Catalinimonas alkaloidigena TaxID=1075417 RepID=A0A1G9GXX3_9BACT|nr:head GIN domain-containing protein [Catalinimonas alkaloidigena]SDL05435.1 Putative auto-transporter adhesin, head GIN domain [Catalinimonas alkaloidigena]
MKKALFPLLLGLLLPLSILAQSREKRTIRSFSELEISGIYEVYLRQGNTESLELEADEDVMDKLITENKGDRLVLRMEHVRMNQYKNRKVKAYITCRRLDRIEMSGATHLQGETPLHTKALAIGISGAGDVRLEIDTESLEASISGAGDLRVTGRTGEQRVEISGAGDYKSYDLASRRAEVRVSGAGSANVTVSEEIDAHASGAGNVYYKGSPSRTNVKSSGAGSVKKVS